MNIYSETNYRKIYEQHYGPIPKDTDGRSYEIHHIDGNHNNNDINNLRVELAKTARTTAETMQKVFIRVGGHSRLPKLRSRNRPAWRLRRPPG